jgi:hypothetical protein
MSPSAVVESNSTVMIERRKVDDILESFVEDQILGASAITSF